ncbi:hypothetical protein BXZ70DRAFT_1008679 [Cristinia sonorae]|uniref:DRBM domain-containing protein n=1 Tax=Cristinia sonorae TaxID=1940300 RepID=A0A8K0UN44_9AGAR|nr:hypothetical protein BXZ70DRAFT_1008679 [Cristinia sonorae]
MPEQTHARLRLNNLLQRTIGTGALTWEQTQIGSEHSGYWEVVALIRYVPYGRGTGRSIGEAREAAAHEAYAQLYNELNAAGYRPNSTHNMQSVDN